MRTNIVLDDELVKKAFLLAPQIKTKKDLVDEALKEFVQVRKAKKLEDLRGVDLFSNDYDYKKMREGNNGSC